MNSSIFPSLTRATTGDVPAVLALLRDNALLEQGVPEAIGDFFVARNSRALVGCAGLEVHGKLGLLRSVAVLTTARGTGLGTQLVESVVALARERALRELFLLTTTAPQFFERRGFAAVPRSQVPSEIAESWEFRVGCPQTALPMRFALETS